MYDNIGAKIKGLAKALFIIESIVSALTGFCLLGIEDMELLGILLMFLIPILAWISSWILYGFGELVDKTCEIAYNTSKNSKPLRLQADKEI